jgi:type I restriction enzyme S subunit
MNTLELVGANGYVSEGDKHLFLPDRLWQTVWNKDIKFDPRWIGQLLSSDLGRRFLKSIASGTSGSMKNISKYAFLNAEIPCPTYPEQKGIASILLCWDNAILNLESLLAAKIERRRWQVQQLLTGHTRFKEFEGDLWCNIQLGDIITFEPRIVAKPKGTFLAAGVRSHGKGLFLKTDFQAEDIALDELFALRTNDLVVNITFGWEGAAAIVPPEADGALVSHRFPTFRFKPGVSFPGYFRHVIKQKRFVHEMGLASPGGAGRNRVLSKTQFLNIPIDLPSFIEQERIAAVLNCCDQEINLLQKQLDAFKEQKRGLMQKLLTGQIRVRT